MTFDLLSIIWIAHSIKLLEYSVIKVHFEYGHLLLLPQINEDTQLHISYFALR